MIEYSLHLFSLGGTFTRITNPGWFNTVAMHTVLRSATTNLSNILVTAGV